MQTAHDMKLAHTAALILLCIREDLLQRFRVGSRIILLNPESTELATVDTYIGVVDMAVVNEVGLISMNLFTGNIRKIAHPQ